MVYDRKRRYLSDRLVDSVREAMSAGNDLLGRIPGTVTRIIAEDLWRVRYHGDPAKPAVHFTRWEEFCRAEPLPGLGVDPAKILKLCTGHLEAEAALARVMGGGHGGDRRSEEAIKLDNVQLDPVATGNARPRAIRRLQRQRPDLFARVQAGELSPHAACLEAGWRQRMVSVPVEDAERLVGVLVRQCAPAILHAIVTHLHHHLGRD